MRDNYQQIRAEIKLLESEISCIDDKLKIPTSRFIENNLRIERERIHLFLQQHKDSLAESVVANEEPRLTYPAVLGSEVTQGLSDYELVAGKDTLARVYLGNRQLLENPISFSTMSGDGKSDAPKAMHFDLPSLDMNKYFGPPLDFAALTINGPNGLEIEIPGELGDGKFSNYWKSYSETDNVNFYIDGSQLPKSGRYTFTARFYRSGQLVGTHELGQHQFHPTKDLRVLIVVNTWPMTAAAWSALFTALQYIQAKFPIRAGIGPLDGNQTAGLRYLIDPRPFDSGWPEWIPARARLETFNADQAARGKPDRADFLLIVRTQQDFEGLLGGTGGGHIAGVVLNVNPPYDDVFATLISQEIGHTFINEHTPDPEISAVNAFNMKDRTAIANPVSIMYGTYSDSKNTDSLFLPADWRKIRLGLMEGNSTGGN